MNKKQKFISTIIGTIFLGAIGSGVWQYILEPAISSGSNVLLNIATLGVEEFKNSLYEEIAKGFHEEASIRTLYIITTILSVALFLISLFFLEKSRNLTINEEEIEKDLEFETKEELLEEIKKIKIEKNELTATMAVLRKKLKRSSYVLLVTSLAMVVMLFLESITISYTNSAVTYYKQIISIISPKVDNLKILEYNARFSSIKSSENYKSLISDVLKNVEVKDSHPKFDIW